MASHSGMELNKIAAAVLLAGLIGLVTGKVTDFLYGGEESHHGAHIEAKRGYSIDVPEGGESGSAVATAPQGAPDITALLASADAAKGAAFFGKKCAVCHTAEKGVGHKVGPNLWGVMERKIAAAPGFNFSDGLKAHAGEDWSVEHMNQFQYNPRKWAPGTIMAYAGTKKDQDRADLIAYLYSLSDNPKPLPQP